MLTPRREIPYWAIWVGLGVIAALIIACYFDLAANTLHRTPLLQSRK